MSEPPVLSARRRGRRIAGSLRAGVCGYLQAAEAKPMVISARERALGLRVDIADLERRLQRQILALESDHAAPALRKRVMQRVRELDGVVAEHRQTLQRLAANTPTLATVPDRVRFVGAPGTRPAPGELPQDGMRVLLESLQFQTTYDPQERALTIKIALADSGQTQDDVSQVWSVHNLPGCERG